MQGLLSHLRGWSLDHREQDIRGWPLRDPEGQSLGVVRDFVVDTNTERVREIVLRDGRRFSAHDILIGSGVLTLGNGQYDELLRRRSVAEAKDTRAHDLAATAAAAAAAAKAAAKRAGAKAAAATRKVAHAPRPVLAEGTDRLVSLVDEEIEIGKRPVDAGGVRVETHVEAKPFRQDVKLQEERIALDRKRVNRPISPDAAAALLHDEAIEMGTKAETAVVDKYAHVVEEIILTREAEDHVARVTDSVRHTDVEITELPGRTLETKKGRTA